MKYHRTTISGQRLQISIAIRTYKDKRKRPQLTKKLLQAILDYRLTHGRDPEGARITGVIWERPHGTWVYDKPYDIEAVMLKLAQIRQQHPDSFLIGSALLKK